MDKLECDRDHETGPEGDEEREDEARIEFRFFFGRNFGQACSRVGVVRVLLVSFIRDTVRLRPWEIKS